MFLKFKKNTLLTSVATLTSGAAIAKLVVVLSSPIITRLYTSADMGMLASLLAITGVLGVIATGTYDQAIVLPENEKDANALVFLSGSIVVIFSIIVTISVVFLFEPLVFILGSQDIPRIWIYGIGFFVALAGFNTILHRLAIRRRQFKVLATTSVIQQIGTNGTKIGSGLLSLGANGLLIATVFGELVRGIRLFFVQRDFFLNNENIPSFDRIKQVTYRYKKFPLISSWSLLLNTASAQLPVIMFASFFSASVAGHYALSHRILSLPMGIIGQNVGQVFLEHASRARDDFGELKRIIFEAYKKLLFIGSITMSFVVFHGNMLFPFIFGAEWVVAGQYAQWISIWLVFQFVASPLTVIYIVLEKQTEFFFVNVVMFILRTGVIFGAFIMGLSDINMVIVFSVLGALVYFLWGFRILHLVRVPFLEALRYSLTVILPVIAIQFMFLFMLIKT